MRARALSFVVIAAMCAHAARAQDKPAAPALRLVPSAGKPVGFKVRFESSSGATTPGMASEPPRISTHEMLVSVEVAPDASGALTAVFRIARVSGTATRLGQGSFGFDSESALPADVMTRNDAFRFTVLAGTEFRLAVDPDGSVGKVGGVEAARKLASARIGGGDDEADASISEESVRGLFKSLLGPAPFPKGPLTAQSAWIDADSLTFDSWDATYEIDRTVRPTAIAADVVKVSGKGSTKLGSTRNIALMPLQMCRNLQATVASEWTISVADGLPILGSETLSLEGRLAAGKEAISAKHKATFSVSRLAAPPPPPVRPLAGAKDAAEFKSKEAAGVRAEQDERRKQRERDGTRGAWGISADGTVVAAGNPACDVEVWKTDGTRPVAVLKGHTTLSRYVAVSASDSVVYSCAEDGTVRGWNLATGKQLTLLGKPNETMSMGGHEMRAGYTSVAVSPDGRYKGFVRFGVDVWDVKLKGWMDPSPSTLFPRELHFLPDCRRVVVSGLESLSLFDLQAKPVKETTLPGEPDELVLKAVWERSRPMLPGGRDAATAPGPGYLIDAVVLDAPGIVVTLAGPDVLDSKSSAHLQAWGLADGVRRWDVTTTARRLLDTHAGAAIVTEDATGIRLISPKDGKLVRTLPRPAAPQTARVFAPDGSAWFDADRDGNLVRVAIDAAPAPK